jgi:hypothetical protein
VSRTLTLLLILLLGCAPAPSPTEPPTVGGLLPNDSLARALQLLAPARAIQADEDGKQKFQLKDATIDCELGVVKRILGERLDSGGGTVRIGDAESAVTRLLGQPDESFTNQDGLPVLLYQRKGFRCTVSLKDSRVAEILITPDNPPGLPQNPAEYGVGTYGDRLGESMRLDLDGVALGMDEAEVTVILGPSDPRLSGDTLAYAEVSTLVCYGDKGARSVLGRKLFRNDSEWVTAGMPAESAQKKLAQVGRLKSQSGSVVAYTFLNLGDVRLRIDKDGTVGALELSRP